MRSPHFWRWSFKPLLLALASVWGAPTVAAQPEHRPNVIVVQFAPEVSFANKSSSTGLQTFDRTAATYGVHTIERVYPFLDHVEPTPRIRRNLMALRRTYYVRYHANAAPKYVAKQLEGVPGVVYAEPVLVNRAQAFWERVDPDDPRFGEQTELRHLRLPEAWDVVKSESGSPRVVIAIVDTGGDWRHEDLLDNVWTNPNEIPGNGADDDNNGFIDDVHGVNLANRDETDNDPKPLPGATHGTLTAGSASAVTDNTVGIAGAAWNADLMHVNSQALIYGYEGILYAAANGADIINASWAGSGYSDQFYRIVDETLNLATDMGSLVVASAANAGLNNDLNLVYPARHPRVLSVGATEEDSRVKAGFSHFGKLVNVFAPGVSVLTTSTDNEYRLWGGTSASSPLTAGVAALVKTRFPDMTPDAVREQVRLSSENMDAENPGLVGQLGRGYVNALAAVQEPTLPAVRLKWWSWVDSDGDRQITSGDAVAITATVVNYLVDAQQLTVGLVGAEPYAFLDMMPTEVHVGSLASGDSTKVRFEFKVATDAPANQWVRFYTRMREGAHTDEADMISLRINYELESVHESLSALYMATGGDSWNRNDNWDITTVPTEDELYSWFGVRFTNGFLGQLYLTDNNLTGEIPAELGDLLHLQVLELGGNSLSGAIPTELGNLSLLQKLNLSGNALTGMLPRSLMQLGSLGVFYFGGQDLCAPQDDDFQAWLSSIPDVRGPTCSSPALGGNVEDQTFTMGIAIPPLVLPEAVGGLAPFAYTLDPVLPAGLVFDATARTITGTPTVTADQASYTYTVTDANAMTDSVTFSMEVVASVSLATGVPDQSFPRTQPIVPLVLPEATGGAPPVSYTLTPTLLAGLTFDQTTRTLSGVPTVVTSTPVPYTYKATGANGSADSLTFRIEVYSPVSTEQELLPEAFAVRGNYPNPFQHATRIVFDLPWDADVTVEVLDMLGRRMLLLRAQHIAGGWERSIEIRGGSLPSGLYMYRVHVSAPVGEEMRVGRLLHLK